MAMKKLNSAAQRLRMPAEDDPAVVRHVQPLVGVGGPRIGPFDAGDERSELRARRRPETEGAVDVEPCAMRLGEPLPGSNLPRILAGGIALAAALAAVIAAFGSKPT